MVLEHRNLLDSHEELCRENEVVRVKMPKEGSSVKFRNNYKKMDMPFIIYADFESLMKPLSTLFNQILEKTLYGEEDVTQTN